MDLKMKQRLVGLFVVLALLAIFIPMISYKMQPKKGIHLSTIIPAAPAASGIVSNVSPAAISTASSGPAENKSPSQNAQNPSTTPGAAVLSQVAAKDLDKASEDELAEANDKDVITSGKEKLTQLPPDERSASSEAGSREQVAGRQQASVAEAPSSLPSASLSQHPAAPSRPLALSSARPKVSRPSHELSSRSLASLTPPPSPTPLGIRRGLTAGSSKSHRGTWVVQLGSFSNQKNISILEAKLASKGIPSFERKDYSHSGMRVKRIFVGPLLTQQQALAMKRKLQARLNINGIIKRNIA